MKLPAFIGHRGGTYFPENTLESYKEAERIGAQAIEVDVRLTCDHQLVIAHDPDLVRTVGVPFLVEDITYNRFIEQKVYMDGKHFSLIGLDTLLEFVQQSNMLVNIEIKPHHGKEPIVGTECIRLLTEYNVVERVLISSYSITMLQVFHELAPNIPLGLVADKATEEVLGFARDLEGVVSIHVDNAWIENQHITSIKQAGFYCYVFTINDKQRAEELFKAGIDGVFTDFILKMNSPEQLLEENV